MGEAANLVNSFKVDNVIFNCESFNFLENNLIKTLDNNKIKHFICINKLNIKNHIFYFLNTKKFYNENDDSSVKL